MANPTPRADALRAMREARFEAAQRQNKLETGKTGTAPAKAKPAAKAEPDVVADAELAPAAVTEPVAGQPTPVTAGDKVKGPKTKKASAKPAAESGANSEAKPAARKKAAKKA